MGISSSQLTFTHSIISRGWCTTHQMTFSTTGMLESVPAGSDPNILCIGCYSDLSEILWMTQRNPKNVCISRWYMVIYWIVAMYIHYFWEAWLDRSSVSEQEMLKYAEIPWWICVSIHNPAVSPCGFHVFRRRVKKTHKLLVVIGRIEVYLTERSSGSAGSAMFFSPMK